MSRLVIFLGISLSLLQAGCGGKSSPELVAAVNRGDVVVAQKLLEEGASPDTKSSDAGITVLSSAASSGDIVMVRLLLKYKASPDAGSSKEFSPLNLVAVSGLNSGHKILIIRSLIDAGADPNKKSFGNTLLHSLCNESPDNPPVIREAIRLGADPTVKSDGGTTAIDMATEKNIDVETLEYMRAYKAYKGKPAPKFGNSEGCKVTQVNDSYDSDGLAGIFSTSRNSRCMNGLADGLYGVFTFYDGRVCHGSWNHGRAKDIQCTPKTSNVVGEVAKTPSPLQSDQSIAPLHSGSPAESPGEQPKTSRGWLGNRILAMAGDPSGPSPDPMIAKEILQECKFTGPKDDPTEYSAKSCEIQDVAPSRSRASEKLSVTPLTARCCLNALKIEQIQADNDGGLDLFALPGVTKSKLSCSKMEEGNTAGNGTEFWLVSKSGTPVFAIREDSSSGSGGTMRSTTIFFKKSVADCAAFESLADDLDNFGKVIYLESTPKPAVTQRPLQPKTAPTPLPQTMSSIPKKTFLQTLVENKWAMTEGLPCSLNGGAYVVYSKDYGKYFVSGGVPQKPPKQPRVRISEVDATTVKILIEMYGTDIVEKQLGQRNVIAGTQDITIRKLDDRRVEETNLVTGLTMDALFIGRKEYKAEKAQVSISELCKP